MLDVSSPIRVRRPFYYDGPIPRSKSWLNRALILRSIFSGLTIEGWHPSDADGEDVTHIEQALRDLAAGKREFRLAILEQGFGFFSPGSRANPAIFLFTGVSACFRGRTWSCIACSVHWGRKFELNHRLRFDSVAAVGPRAPSNSALTLVSRANLLRRCCLRVRISARVFLSKCERTRIHRSDPAAIWK